MNNTLKNHFFFFFLSASYQGNAEATFEAQTRVHSAFNRLLSSCDGNWLIPALIVICKNTNHMAVIADQQISLNSKSQQRHHHAKLEKASPILQESYSKTFNDRVQYVPGAPFDSNGSKQAGVLAIGKFKKKTTRFIDNV